MEKSAETQYNGVLLGRKVKFRRYAQPNHLDFAIEMEHDGQLLGFYCSQDNYLTLESGCPYSSDVLLRVSKAAATLIALAETDEDVVLQL